MDVKALFEKLVNIDSPSGSEAALAEYITEFCSSRGIRLEKDQAGNLYFANKRTKLLLTAHMDTVQGEDHIEVVEIDGKIQSKSNTILGADDKAGLAGILTVIDYYYRNKLELDFEILFTVEEELGMKGVKQFDTSNIFSKRVLSFDKSEEDFGNIVIEAPYGYSILIEIEGKASHSSLPEKALSVLPVLSTLLKEIPVGRINNSTTLNFGTVNIGTTPNTVPGIVTIKGDIRSDNIEDITELIERIKISLDKIDTLGYKTEFTSNQVITGYKINQKSPFFRIVKENVSGLTGKPPNLIKTQSGSDLAVLAQKGVEGMLVASGTRGCHTNHEEITVEDLRKIPDLIISILKKTSSDRDM